MKPRNLSCVAGTGTLALLLVLTGCNQANKSGGAAQIASPPPGATNVTTDARIPEARRAELERTIAAKQAGMSQIDERMRAAPKPKQ